jgi:hypothetical protein
MQVNRTIMHTRDLLPVILPPVSNDEQQDNNLEPQYVKIRAQNHGRLYIDSQKPFYEFTPNDVKISTAIIQQGRAENLTLNINRLAVAKFDMFWQPQNVNSYNNVFKYTLFNTVGPVPYEFTHTIPVGNYTLASLLTVITNLMTFDSATLGYTGGFSSAVDANGFTATITDNIPVTNFIIDAARSSMVYNGASLLGLSEMSAPVTVLNIGPARMLYSRYVDVVSRDLCSYVKNPSRSINKVNQNVIFRQYLDDPNARWTYSTTVNNMNWMNWNYNAPLSVISFELYDEYGNLFYYVPPALPLSSNTLNWLMEVMLEA